MCMTRVILKTYNGYIQLHHNKRFNMSKRILFPGFPFLATLFFTLLISCGNDDNFMTVNENESKTEFAVSQDDGDTTVFQINTNEDLRRSLRHVVEEREQSLLEKGWVKVEEESKAMNVLRARRKIWIDTVYIDKETPDLSEDPSKYANFKAKFGRKMVDSINKVVSPEYRISTRKTYVCRWRLYEAYYNANPGEQVAVRPSPLCALIPEKKSSYTERGYTLYTHESNDMVQYQMDSYQLRIQWESTSHRRIVLDIDWPFFPKNPSGAGHIGYQFIYAVSKRL